MPEPTPEAWAQIRHAYENTDRPLAHICAEHGVTIPTVRYRMKRWGWRRRKPLIPRHGPPPVPAMAPEMATTVPCAAPVHPAPAAVADALADDHPPSSKGEENIAVVPRLQAAAARMLPAIEAAVARLASGTLNPDEMEKAGRTLGTLMRALREINALLVQHNAPLCGAQPDDDPVPKDMDEFRYELARRIRAFIAARDAAGGARPGQEAGPESQRDPAAAMDGPAQA